MSAPGGFWSRSGKAGRLLGTRAAGNVPLLFVAVIGMVVTFGAGWALGAGRDQADGQSVSSRTLAEGTETPGTGTPSPSGTASATPTPPIGSVTTAAATPGAVLPAVSKAARPPIKKFSCPAATVKVSTAADLTAALAAARPGASIALAGGTYQGKFQATRSGTARHPVYLCGPKSAILDAGAIKGGYTLHLNGSSYWRVKGFTVQDGQKGVVLDGVTGVALQGLLVRHIGDEAVHLRRDSTRNVVRGLRVQETGLRKPKFGEGIYIGSARSNWCSVNNCQMDRSDGNFVISNVVSGTAAEAVDIKEGTTGGVVSGNTFNGTGMTGADSWVDVKGDGWLISGNKGSHAPTDGYQVHQILVGWGSWNLFSGNVSAVDAGGYAIKVTKPHDNNVVRCNNRASGAGEGLTNIPCS